MASIFYVKFSLLFEMGSGGESEASVSSAIMICQQMRVFNFLFKGKLKSVNQVFQLCYIFCAHMPFDVTDYLSLQEHFMFAVF